MLTRSLVRGLPRDDQPLLPGMRELALVLWTSVFRRSVAAVVPELAEILRRGGETAREAAALALWNGGLRAAEALPALIRAMDDANSYVRTSASSAVHDLCNSLPRDTFRSHVPEPDLILPSVRACLSRRGNSRGSWP